MKKSLSVKKLMSVLLLIVMLLSMLPAAYAEGGTEPIIIDEISILLPENFVGLPCTVYTRDDPSGYTKVGTWYKGNEALDENDIKIEGEDYRFNVVFTPKSGYKFAEPTKIYVENYDLSNLVPVEPDGTILKSYSGTCQGYETVRDVELTLPADPVTGETANRVSGEGFGYDFTMYW